MSISVSRRLAQLGLYIVLSGCSRDPMSTLIAQLGDPDAGVRRAAARSLNELPSSDDRVIATLAKCAADTDAEVRYFSIAALGKNGLAARSSLPALKSDLEDPEKGVRLQAALAIHKIDPQDRSIMPVLTSAMREGDGKTLLEVGGMGADGAWAVPTLIGLLSHESAQVRVLAANDLGRIGPAAGSAKAALQASIGDPNAAVKRAAQTALSQIQPKPAGISK
jgi:HEAT repeat protein